MGDTMGEESSFNTASAAQVVYIMGFAGAGKSTLAKEFSEFLRDLGYRVAIANLDPGAEILPYKPDYDVRSMVRLVDIMRRENLGPNGGLIRATEIIVERISEVIDYLQRLARLNDWLLVDTTGQLELFAFRELGERIVTMLELPSVGIYLVDASMFSEPSDVVMTQLISLAIQYRLGINVITIVNKVDSERIPVRVLMEEFFFKPEDFKQRISSSDLGVLADLAYDLIDSITRYLPPTRIITISALKRTGFDDLYSILHETFCTCGDMT